MFRFCGGSTGVETLACLPASPRVNKQRTKTSFRQIMEYNMRRTTNRTRTCTPHHVWLRVPLRGSVPRRCPARPTRKGNINACESEEGRTAAYASLGIFNVAADFNYDGRRRFMSTTQSAHIYFRTGRRRISITKYRYSSILVYIRVVYMEECNGLHVNILPCG